MDTWTPVHPSIGLISGLNPLGKLAIFSLMFTHRTLEPGIIPTHGHIERLTEQAHRILPPMVFNKLEPYGWLREKMSTAFFNISRSCLTLSNSRLSWRSSSSCAV